MPVPESALSGKQPFFYRSIYFLAIRVNLGSFWSLQTDSPNTTIGWVSFVEGKIQQKEEKKTNLPERLSVGLKSGELFLFFDTF